jgi:hypothetical protein
VGELELPHLVRRHQRDHFLFSVPHLSLYVLKLLLPYFCLASAACLRQSYSCLVLLCPCLIFRREFIRCSNQ